MNHRRIYVIGSLRNPHVPNVADYLRTYNNAWEVFDDWYAAGPKADDHWKEYEQGARRRSYREALAGRAATNTFRYDKANLDRCDMAVLVLPAGRSGHLELGYFIGTGKPGFILLDDPDRWDVMYKFATDVCEDMPELVSALNRA